jgi:uncharacterized membrane protein
MTDAGHPAPHPSPFLDERQLAMIVYGAYLLGLILWPLGVAGLVLAYVNRDAAPDWLKTHYTFQIRTFWITFLYFFLSAVLCVVLIGFPLLVATAVLFVVRCALGLNFLLKHEPYPRPETWTT